MSELYLCAHKVRGEPAFDIMTHCECPECLSMGCPECDDLGYWWIVPTSGHRAYPFMNWPLKTLCQYVPEHSWQPNVLTVVGPAESHPNFIDLPDHYPHRAASTLSLAEALGLAKPTPPAPIVRRF